MSEVWKEIPGYGGVYQASSLGRIRSLPRLSVNGKSLQGRILRQSDRPRDYRSVNLYPDGRHETRLVHQLVCAAFHGARPDELPHTRHLDGNPSNNVPENLRWGTGRENSLDSVRHGTHWPARKDACPSGHAFTDDNTYRYRSNARVCKTCERSRSLAYYHRKKGLSHGA